MKLIFFIIAAIISSLNLLSQEIHSQELHCKHFFYGCPLGASKSNDLIIRDIYALSNNDSTKFADWVAYKLDRQIISGSTKKRVWKTDPWLDDNETLEPEDYKGAPEALNIDRGHQAPLASFSGSDVWFESNYLSNITPQKAELNRGPWKILEEKERKLLDSFPIIYIMTGTLYERKMGLLPNADEVHKIPSGYWKIIIVPTIKNDFEIVAFIFDQDTKQNSPISNHIVSVDEIELRSHLDFLSLLDNKIESIKEHSLNKSWFMKYF